MEKITQNLRYIYGETLLDKATGQPSRVTLTIKGIVDDTFMDGRTGSSTKGFSIQFEKTDKLLGVTGSTVTRQLFLAVGSDDVKDAVGKRITLYPVPSKKSATGWAVRVAKAE